MICDFHTHSYFSGDSSELPSKMLDTAIEKGMKSICFTDHQDFDYNYDAFDFTLDYERYFSELSILRDEYASRINILIGVETGLEPHLSERLKDFVGKKPYDFVIGSTHLINGADPWCPEYFAEYGEKRGFEKYFEYALQSINVCSDFDVYGHLDYIVRYAPNKDKYFSYAEFADVIDEILKKLIFAGKGIELNTGGIYKGMDRPNPAPEIIRRYRELGGEIITVGSDAHTADKIGMGFSEAEKILKNAGFEYYTIFSGRKPQFIKL